MLNGFPDAYIDRIVIVSHLRVDEVDLVIKSVTNGIFIPLALMSSDALLNSSGYSCLICVQV